jgi:raffinose/stachyose/melibiose transport system permease protein
MHLARFIKKYFALFALPTLLAFAIAFIVPFILGLLLSFTKFTTVTDAKWVGADNYVQAFSDNTDFLSALGFTAAFTVVAVVSVNVLAFGLALILTQALKGTNVFRTVFFMPNLIGGIVLGYIWQLIFNGLLFPYDQTLVTYPDYGFWGLVVMTNWQMIGYMMVIYIAGLQNIPSDVLEAAQIDGSGTMSTLFRIKIPLVVPSITICTFLTLTNSFKLFDQNLALTNGAPGTSTQMLALDIYNTFYRTTGFEGVGQAKAVVFFVMVAAIAVLQLRMTRSKELEG